jgi:hypothetical protein
MDQPQTSSDCRIAQSRGHQGTVSVVDQCLEKHNVRKPKAVKVLVTRESEHRNEQFEAFPKHGLLC